MGGIASLCDSDTQNKTPFMDDSNVEDDFNVEKLKMIQMRQHKKRKVHRGLTINDFQLCKVLGQGSFGKIFLVKRKKGHKFYALKCLRKEEVLMKNLLPQVLSEKTILQSLEHPFIVKLRYSFQNGTSVYMAMDFCQGGDLAMLQDSKKKFDVEFVKFYTAEIILALQYIHEKLNVVHRDIKPENIMLTADGHIKLTDFGIAKVTNKAFSLCGTPEYVAPEIILGEGYCKEVDWWSLGCLIYQMLIGVSPFECKDRTQLPLYILEKQPELPEEYSTDLKDFILGLLEKDPKKRLGHNGAQEIKRHAFFKGIEWERVLKRHVTPPFVPTLEGKDDVRYFPEVKTLKACNYEDKISSGGECPESESKSLNQDFPAFTYVGKESVHGSISISKVHLE